MEINKMKSFSQVAPKTAQAKKETDSTPSDMVELGKGTVPEGVHKKWLFMNYIAADCNLKEFQYKNIDNQEIVGSDKNTHIVAMIDVGPNGGKQAEAIEGEKAEASVIDFKGCKTFYVTKDNVADKVTSPVVSEQGLNVDTSSAKTLTEFVVNTMKKFPSDHVALILNDHGGGWTGAMSDETNGNLMSVPDIRVALEEAEKITGKKIDILGFDACLMADVQAAYEFKDNAKILLASEESEAGPGWTYNEMLDPKKPSGAAQKHESMAEALGMLQKSMEKKIDVSPEEFAKLVVKVNENHQGDICTFSATDLEKMGPLAGSIDEFAKTVLDTNEGEAVKKAILGAENYGSGWSPYGDMHDLYQVADNVENSVSDPKVKAAAQGIKKAFNEAVIANEVSSEQHPNSKGLHIYAKMDKEGLEPAYKDLKFAKEIPSWVNAVEKLGLIEVPGEREKTIELMGGISIPAPGIMDIWPDGTPK